MSTRPSPIVLLRARCAFTIVELLVVISIISILLAMLLPALSQARDAAQVTLCAANCRSWGQALGAYANDNDGYFPYNGNALPPDVPVGGQHVSWNSSVVQAFWAAYMTANTQSSKTDENDVLNCPTQKWHQINDVGLGGGLVGYFYLPHRNPNNINYTHAQAGRGNAWVAKTRMFGPDSKKPILMDMLQEHKTHGWWWTDGSTPFSSHIDGQGQPRGGNFLFEDAHVDWHPRDDVLLGADMSGWYFYYDIPVGP